MVETILVRTDLSDNLISAGRRLLVGLDDCGIEFDAAFWLMDEENGLWHLTFSSRAIKTDGTVAQYKRIDKVIARLRLNATLWLGMISIVGDRTPLVQSLRSVLGTAKSVDGARLDNAFVNGVRIPGCLLYRLARRQKLQVDEAGDRDR